ncbi:MAG: hypothetical protein HY548_08675 [Elusimicrobia bacterium]|nr:hypothetical protein [Elusimicrobiota bacterium]
MTNPTGPTLILRQLAKFFARTLPLALGGLLLAAAIHADATPVTIDKTKKQLLVNGQPFAIRGVNYAPTRAGSRPGSPSNYNLFNDAELYNIDFPLLKSMGANTIRVFDARNATTAALNAAQSNGLYVAMGFPINESVDITNTSTRTAIVSDFTALVNRFKDHAAVLFWAVGNEVTLNNTSASTNTASWYSLVDACAAAAHAADPNHPVTTVNADINNIGVSANNTTADNPSNLDFWGVTLYRGPSFQTAFSDFVSRSDKPMWVAEFGSDAYNSASAAEDESTQASVVRSLWLEIEANLSATVNGKAVLGGNVFEWSDEWWKGKKTTLGDGGTGGDFAHDTGTDWTNANYADTSMQEEWWGLVAISSSNIYRRPREAYYTLQSLWNPSTPSSGVVFNSKMSNFPNPMVLGGNTQITATLYQSPDTVKIEIFDSAYRRVRGLTAASTSGNVVTATWNGTDEDGRQVSAGVYLCRMEITANSRTEVKIRRIAVVR